MQKKQAPLLDIYCLRRYAGVFSMMEVLPVDVFRDAAIPIIRRSVDVENKTQLRLWQEHFGVSPVVVCSVWNRMSLWCTMVLFADKMQAEASIVDPLVSQGLRHRADPG